MIDRATLARGFEQDKLERRFGDGEVRIAGTSLRRLGAEELGVEVDGAVEIVDVEGELDSRHLPPSYIGDHRYLATTIEVRQYVIVTQKARPPECCSLLAAPIDEAGAVELASAFHALSDPARLRLLSLIAAQPAGEACACELVEPLGKSQPTVSHHLKVLYEARLVDREKRGTWIWYWVVPERMEALRAVIAPAALKVSAEHRGPRGTRGVRRAKSDAKTASPQALSRSARKTGQDVVMYWPLGSSASQRA
jgi:ArsR family transcriptional regulator